MNSVSSLSINLYRWIIIAIMGTIAVLLMLVSFPLPFIPAYLRIDVSDIPALLAAVVFSPVAGVLVILIKNILYAILTGFSDPIGVIANLIAGILYIAPVSILYMKHKTMRSVINGLIIGTLSMTMGMVVLNYFFILPAYSWFMGWEEMSEAAKRNIVLVGMLPFNVIKGMILGIVFTLIFSRLKKWIEKNRA